MRKVCNIFENVRKFYGDHFVDVANEWIQCKEIRKFNWEKKNWVIWKNFDKECKLRWDLLNLSCVKCVYIKVWITLLKLCQRLTRIKVISDVLEKVNVPIKGFDGTLPFSLREAITTFNHKQKLFGWTLGDESLHSFLP